jgi:dGTPase
VAQVARSVATALGLNEPITEALALAHDIGHPPFGHRGEVVLDELMRENGGFRHNAQVLRVVDRLERRSPVYRGLNLTREVRESLLKHEMEWPEDLGTRPRHPYLEAQVVDLADSTAYHVHDVEDGLIAGMFDEEDLLGSSALWRWSREAVARRYPGFIDSTGDKKLRVRTVANELIKLCINDLITASCDRLAASGVASSEAARSHPEPLIGHSREVAPLVKELRAFLYRRFYRHEHLLRLSEHARGVLTALFSTDVAQPDEMAPWYLSWAEEVGCHRAVCDYLAGMTDRFAEQEHRRLTE